MVDIGLDAAVKRGRAGSDVQKSLSFLPLEAGERKRLI
jgi:hypothetical protein